MTNNELYLKTAFCCMACDGDIATEEVEVIKGMPFVRDANLQDKLSEYVESLKKEGDIFLQKYLDEIKEANLSIQEECELTRIAIQTIEADKSVDYNEIAFFKKIRKRLHLSDEQVLAIVPENSVMSDREDYIMPDISDEDDFSQWGNSFSNLKINNVLFK